MMSAEVETALFKTTSSHHSGATKTSTTFEGKVSIPTGCLVTTVNLWLVIWLSV